MGQHRLTASGELDEQEDEEKSLLQSKQESFVS
jgi:hypothetical protein